MGFGVKEISNQLIITGRVGKVETAGIDKCKFSLAVSQDYKDKTGNWVKKDAMWLSCSAYKETGTMLSNAIAKGMKLQVNGKLSSNNYKDKQGVDRIGLNLMVFEYKVIEAAKNAPVKDDDDIGF